MPEMFYQFGHVIVFIALGAGFIAAALTASQFVAPNKQSVIKTTAYECGELPIGNSWAQFNVRFYCIAIDFLIFDVEVTLLYPTAAVFKSWVLKGYGPALFFWVGSFVAILAVGLFYVWGKGDLKWVKELGSEAPGARAGT